MYGLIPILDCFILKSLFLCYALEYVSEFNIFVLIFTILFTCYKLSIGIPISRLENKLLF